MLKPCVCCRARRGEGNRAARVNRIEIRLEAIDQNQGIGEAQLLMRQAQNCGEALQRWPWRVRKGNANRKVAVKADCLHSPHLLLRLSRHIPHSARIARAFRVEADLIPSTPRPPQICPKSAITTPLAWRPTGLSQYPWQRGNLRQKRAYRTRLKPSDLTTSPMHDQHLPWLRRTQRRRPPDTRKSSLRAGSILNRVRAP